jgi:hypothetical protein
MLKKERKLRTGLLEIRWLMAWINENDVTKVERFELK